MPHNQGIKEIKLPESMNPNINDRKTKGNIQCRLPSIEKHVEISMNRTNKPYREVHEWIDEPENKDDSHDITEIPDTYQMFKEKYGDEAAREYVQHLADDLNGKFNHLIEDVQVLVDKTLAYFGANKQ